jgi:hypothetical protein
MLKPYNRAELMFDLIREIGQDGKNSQAFVARDHQLDAEIVIKRIVKANIQDAGEFFAESKALYASAHPNVVPIHYACEDADHVYRRSRSTPAEQSTGSSPASTCRCARSSRSDARY